MTQPERSATIVAPRVELAKNRADIAAYGDVRHYFVGSKFRPVEACRRCSRGPDDPVHLRPPRGV